MIKRETYLNKLRKLRNKEEIKLITGIRRCGKTSLLKQVIKELEDDGIGKGNIIYISFESSKYNRIRNYKQLDEIIFNKTKNLDGKIYLFFDEIQNVKHWQKSINAYKADLNSDIYIAGSNSSIVSGELTAGLTGRYIAVNMHPFSYNELLQYYLEEYDNELDYNKEFEIFKDYITYSGFPALLKYNKEEKEDYLSDLYNAIIAKDIISMKNMQNINLFKTLQKYVIENIGQIFSANSISKHLKHEKINTTYRTIMNYRGYAVEAYMIYRIKREDAIGKKALNTLGKYYLIDRILLYIQPKL